MSDPHPLPVIRGWQGDGASCDIAEAGENAWVEWPTIRGNQRCGPNLTAGHEDGEDDGDLGDHSASEDDCRGIGAKALQRLDGGPGCGIPDPGGCEHNGCEPDTDAEVEQMSGEVPALHVYSLDHNIFTDQRILLARPGPGGSVYLEVDARTPHGASV